jgi:hypothetical protein
MMLFLIIASVSLILGELGYFEKMWGIKWKRRTILILMIAFLTVSVGQAILTYYNNLALQRSSEEKDRQIKQLEKDAATAQLELERLKEKQTPWTLSKDQLNSLRDSLTRAPKGAIEVRYILSEAERAGKFAKTLATIFQQSGYDVYSEIGMFSNTSDPPPVGLLLIFRSEQDRERALTYCKILNAISIPAECVMRNDADQQLDPWINKAVSIYVRNKPIKK